MIFGNRKVSASDVLKYYSSNAVLEHYEDATQKVGLWKSESIIFAKAFEDKSLPLLELGCGSGRIAFGMAALGYAKIIATDFSKKMVERAIRINEIRRTAVDFQRQDATGLGFADDQFDGVIFGFNGLMQIPGGQNRLQAMKECFRVLRSGGRFVFTAHDQSLPKWKKFWIREKKKWTQGSQDPSLLEFGDRFEETAKGKLFLHVPAVNDLRNDLQRAGFRVEGDFLRSRVADEDSRTRQYSDECRFWVCRKPAYDERFNGGIPGPGSWLRPGLRDRPS